MAYTPSLADRLGPYDEARMIGRTVLRYHLGLLTPLEHEVRFNFFARAKAEAYDDPTFEDRWRARLGMPDTPEARRVTGQGIAAFQTLVGLRLQREGSIETALNRCPACRKVAITPWAQWCIWCRHDWHPSPPPAA